MQNFFALPVAQAAGVIANATPISQVLWNVLNFLLSVLGVVGILGIVVAGIIYLTAAGNEQQMKRAKRALYASIIGLMVALGSLVIIAQLGNIFS